MEQMTVGNVTVKYALGSDADGDFIMHRDLSGATVKHYMAAVEKMILTQMSDEILTDLSRKIRDELERRVDERRY